MQSFFNLSSKTLQMILQARSSRVGPLDAKDLMDDSEVLENSEASGLGFLPCFLAMDPFGSGMGQNPPCMCLPLTPAYPHWTMTWSRNSIFLLVTDIWGLLM